jgi:ribosome biogenesis GTPase A
VTSDATVAVGQSAPTTGNEDLLHAYREEKLELADGLLTLMHLAESRKDTARAEQLRALAARLAEDRFQLAVVGQFSRGKSSLMNAILGAPWLPTGALPMTSIITTVTYGSAPRATIRRKGGLVPIDAPLSDLPRYVAQASTEREELQVATADIELPAEILRLGFAFVDTPGVGSAITANTETTLGFLPDADAVIFVTSFDSPLTESEVAFLGSVRDEVARTFVVLNKRDLIEGLEAAEVERFVRARLSEVGIDDPQLFALSATEGLAAKRASDTDALQESGLARLEAELVDYLTNEKSQEFLLRMSERVARFIDVFASEARAAAALSSEGDGAARLSARGDDLFTRYDARRRALLADLSTSLSSFLDELSTTTAPAAADRFAAALSAAVGDGTGPGDTVHFRRDVDALTSRTREIARAWSEEETASWLAELQRVGAVALEELDHLPDAVEVEMATTFGATPPVERGAGAFRPRPAVGTAAWTIAPPRERSITSRALGMAPLDEVLGSSAEAHIRTLVARVRATASEWLNALNGWSERQLQDATARARTRLSTPPDATFEQEIETATATLDGVRERVTSWSSETRSLRPSRRPTWQARARGASETGCVTCNRLTKALFQFMAHEQYELAVHVEARLEHAHHGGFCALHTWYYAEIGSPTGISASYARVGETTAAALRDAAANADSIEELRRALAGARADDSACPACAHLEAVALAVRDEVRETLRKGGEVPGLCLDHTGALLGDDFELPVARRVVAVLADRLERRAEDMRTYSLKRESLRGGLIDREEEAAFVEMLRRIASDPLLVTAARNESAHASPWRGSQRRT